MGNICCTNCLVRRCTNVHDRLHWWNCDRRLWIWWTCWWLWWSCQVCFLFVGSSGTCLVCHWNRQDCLVFVGKRGGTDLHNWWSVALSNRCSEGLSIWQWLAAVFFSWMRLSESNLSLSLTIHCTCTIIPLLF